MAFLDRTIVRVLPVVPRGIVRKVSERYIAGTEVEDACRVVKELNAEGKMATIDVLGEEVGGRREALGIVRAYHDVFEAIERERLDSNVSVKLTALGLNLAYELCQANLETVVRHAAESGNFVRIDMEDSNCTSDTLQLYRELREAGLDNVGIVLQAYLRRTIRDIRELAPYTPNVRLCKGIYVEPELIAYQDYEEVRRELRPQPGRATPRRVARGDRDPRHVPHLGGVAARAGAPADTRAVRVPDAARRDAVRR